MIIEMIAKKILMEQGYALKKFNSSGRFSFICEAGHAGKMARVIAFADGKVTFVFDVILLIQ